MPYVGSVLKEVMVVRVGSLNGCRGCRVIGEVHMAAKFEERVVKCAKCGIMRCGDKFQSFI